MWPGYAEADARLRDWQSQWGESPTDPSLVVSDHRFAAVLGELAERLRDNYPFGHIVYAGQMLKPPHPVAAAAYALAMTINPNNHALDGGPATAALEREVVDSLAAMVGYDPATSLGHLTSSGTIANLEALWVARELHPGKAIASSASAHYTHGRMCGVLGIEHRAIRSKIDGAMDLDHLANEIAGGAIGAVVATLGTTSLGAVDDLRAILGICRAHDIRVHVDAAYGGYYRLLADGQLLTPEVAAAFQAMAEADSVVIDPHKHGLQPYGCGSVLFRDASVGRFYQHDSPYTYFTSDELHLGEISLECSRAGAAAAALWATLRLFPLTAEGLGGVLVRTRQAAIDWSALITASEHLALVTDPALDIVCFLPTTGAPIPVSAVTAWTERIFQAGMRPDPSAYYLAKLVMTQGQLDPVRFGHLIWDRPTVTVLRSVLMKPGHADFVSNLHERVLQFTFETGP
jgi:glutamate/tyrosine decarboxylase-like PLP-dependent enzyme